MDARVARLAARCAATLAAAAAACAVTAAWPGDAGARKGCPENMVLVKGTFCIDKYEARVVEVLPKGKVRRHSPYEPVKGLRVKAVSKRKKIPQGYISRDEAEAACKAARKRLCSDEEWLTACRGKRPTTYPYGKEHKDGYCNDKGLSSFNKYFGPPGGGEALLESFTYEKLNDPRLNKLEGTVAPTGEFKRCRSGFGTYDMVGNLHEWTSAPGGTFRGGYYLDTQINGEGCSYKTTAHSPRYHDYSTGFRCCK